MKKFLITVLLGGSLAVTSFAATSYALYRDCRDDCPRENAAGGTLVTCVRFTDGGLLCLYTSKGIDDPVGGPDF